MALPTVQRRAAAVSSTTDATTWTPSWNYGVTNGLNNVIASGLKVRWYAFVSADGNPTLTLNAASDAGWLKADQTSDATNAVTAAVFYIDTTAAYAASAQPALQIDSSASEQFSAVLYAVSFTAGTTATHFFASAQGSSTNSDPPSITNSVGYSVDASVFVSRHGDSTVIPTVHPTNYTGKVDQAAGGTGGASTGVSRRSLTIANAASEDPGTFTVATEQWVCYTLAVYEGYRLTAAAGSYTLTGQTAGLLASRRMAASVGSFGLTGQTAGLSAGRKIAASAGAFTLNGLTAAFPLTRRLSAAAGSFALTGQAAALAKGLRFSAVLGSFILTGQTASLSIARHLAAAAGAFTFTGQAAGLFKGKTLAVSAGSFVLTGNVATFRFGRRIAASAGSFALNGQPAALYKGKTLIALPGTFSMHGYSVTLIRRIPSLPGPAALALAAILSPGAIPSASITNTSPPPLAELG